MTSFNMSCRAWYTNLFDGIHCNHIPGYFYYEKPVHVCVLVSLMKMLWYLLSPTSYSGNATKWSPIIESLQYFRKIKNMLMWRAKRQNHQGRSTQCARRSHPTFSKKVQMSVSMTRAVTNGRSFELKADKHWHSHSWSPNRPLEVSDSGYFKRLVHNRCKTQTSLYHPSYQDTRDQHLEIISRKSYFWRPFPQSTISIKRPLTITLTISLTDSPLHYEDVAESVNEWSKCFGS